MEGAVVEDGLVHNGDAGGVAARKGEDESEDGDEDETMRVMRTRMRMRDVDGEGDEDEDEMGTNGKETEKNMSVFFCISLKGLETSIMVALVR